MLEKTRLPYGAQGVIIRGEVPMASFSGGRDSETGLGDAYGQALVIARPKKTRIAVRVAGSWLARRSGYSRWDGPSENDAVASELARGVHPCLDEGVTLGHRVQLGRPGRRVAATGIGDRDHPGLPGNLIYKPYKLVEIGVEALWGRRENQDSSHGDAWRGQLSVIYHLN